MRGILNGTSDPFLMKLDGAALANTEAASCIVHQGVHCEGELLDANQEHHIQRVIYCAPVNPSSRSLPAMEAETASLMLFYLHLCLQEVQVHVSGNSGSFCGEIHLCHLIEPL